MEVRAMARVEQTNADVYLHEHATIFAYNPASRMLLWSRYSRLGACWELHKNGIQIDRGHAPYVSPTAPLVTHFEMISWALEVQEEFNLPNMPDDYIRGRIAPDKSTIYIHDLKSRFCKDDIRLGFGRHVKFALKKVGMYMKSEKKGVINYDIKKREINRLAERPGW
jgi:hypothetical protein